MPFRCRDALAAKIGLLVGKVAKKQRKRAQVNLRYCLPHWSEQQHEQVIDKMFKAVAQTMLGIG